MRSKAERRSSASTVGGCGIAASPRRLRISRPEAASSAARRGRTRKVTSCWAWSRRPPKYPPMAPAPTTRMRMVDSWRETAAIMIAPEQERFNAGSGVRLAAVPDVEDIAVLHEVFLAFEAELADGARGGLGAQFEQEVPVDGFGADEVLLKIGVDGPGCVLGAGVLFDGPGAALVLANGEE